MRISIRTRLLGLGGIAVIVVAYALILGKVGGESGISASSDIGGLIIDVAASIVVLRTAFAFDRGEPLRAQWLAIAASVVLFTLGDATWAFTELVQQRDVPYPGLPDLFYVALYPAFGIGLFMAAFAYRRLVDVRWPLVLTAIVTLALSAALAVVVIPVLLRDKVGIAETTLSVFYPLGDLLFQLAPALFVALIIVRLHEGALAWPWWAIVAGVIVVAVADTSYSWLEAEQLYYSGHMVDIGWMLGYLLIGIGGSLALDVNVTRRMR